jgi:DNA-binding Lrp family transcriptional regulator
MKRGTSMKKSMFKVLGELMKDAKQSDRNLAKKIGVSQPTVTRARRRLEEEGYIREYTAIPEWRKLGYEILAVTFARLNTAKYMEVSQTEAFRKKVSDFFSDFSNIIFGTYGRGLGMSRMVISIHKNYSDYMKLKSEITNRFGTIAQTDSFIISLEGDPAPVPLTLKRFAEVIEAGR